MSNDRTGYFCCARDKCEHEGIVMPGEPWPGDEAVYAAMRTTGHVNARWPRFYGPCPDCGSTVIKYHSRLHMYMTS